jgi:hypothetical protein
VRLGEFQQHGRDAAGEKGDRVLEHAPGDRGGGDEGLFAGGAGEVDPRGSGGLEEGAGGALDPTLQRRREDKGGHLAFCAGIREARRWGRQRELEPSFPTRSGPKRS